MTLHESMQVACAASALISLIVAFSRFFKSDMKGGLLGLAAMSFSIWGWSS